MSETLRERLFGEVACSRVTSLRQKIKRVEAGMRVGSRVRILIINGGYLPSHSLSSGVVKRGSALSAQRSYGQLNLGWTVIVQLVIHSP